VEDASKERTFYQKRLTRRYKSIHVTLEVKTYFSNSTPVTGPSMKSSLRSLDFLLLAIIGITRRERETYTQKVTKQSLSKYTQQD
jgi:hypothetical protein